MDYVVTPEVVDWIGQFEGFRGTVYDDGFGNPTIGFGLVTSKIKQISREAAKKMLAASLEIRAIRLRKLLRNSGLNQAQFEACLSLSYNIGYSGFKKSSVFEAISNGDLTRAAFNFLTHCRAKDKKTKKLKPILGLLKRRNLEARRFIGADPEKLQELYQKYLEKKLLI